MASQATMAPEALPMVILQATSKTSQNQTTPVTPTPAHKHQMKPAEAARRRHRAPRVPVIPVPAMRAQALVSCLVVVMASRATLPISMLPLISLLDNQLWRSCAWVPTIASACVAVRTSDAARVGT